MAILFYAPDAESWTEYTSDSYWEADSSTAWFGFTPETWNGSAWVSVEWAGGGWYHCWLDVTGSWENSYRPAKVRVSFTGEDEIGLVQIKDTASAVIGSANNVVSGGTIDLSFGANDMRYIQFTNAPGSGGVQYFVTGIEFE